MADAVEFVELGEAEGDDAVVAEGLASLAKLAERADADKVQALLAGEADANDTYLEIHAGAGGTESQDWAEMLLRMYARWAERAGFKVELVEYQAGEQAGIKSATLLIKGENAYGYAKTESGVHRLVRISPYDSSARRHTSFSSVWVYPVIDDSYRHRDQPGDLKIDTYRASGAGGQHINTTDSAVRITHVPSGHRRRQPARPQPAQEPRDRDEHAQGPPLRARDAQARGSGQRRARQQDRYRLGPPDPLLRPAALSDGQGPAHRRHLDHARRCARRRLDEFIAAALAQRVTGESVEVEDVE
jgi:peptide chain release factor 2